MINGAPRLATEDTVTPAVLARASNPESFGEAIVNDQYKWNDEHVVIRSVSAVAVYLNPSGDLVIRQESSMGEEEDSFIVIPVDRIKTLLESINFIIGAK